MTLLRPLPRRLTRPLSVAVLLAWVATMGLLVHRTIQAATLSLGADLARYGTSAQWRGVYSRGEKIGFFVSQTVPLGDGYELQEDGQLQMTLLGATTAARIRTRARVDRAFNLQAFEFSLDPGTGPISVHGTVENGTELALQIRTPSGTRDERRRLPEPPALSLNLPRRLAAAGLRPGLRLEVPVFDPATLRNAPMRLEVESREVVRAAERPVPAFKVRMEFGGIQSTAWVTDVGEVVREESPLGFLIVREKPERATSLAVSSDVQQDLYEAAAIVPPRPTRPIHNPADVTRLRVAFENVDLSHPDLRGAGQTIEGNEVEVVEAFRAPSEPEAGDLSPYLRPELFIESDAPELVAEASRAVGTATGASLKAERLVRRVNALLEKKPTVSLPSAREVFRTQVGDCNEHTVLYVALARAVGVPARIAVGLVFLRGAFYYHAWPEVYLDDARGGPRWAAVDPTLNQFPADATHVRLARGGLDRQTVILSLIGRARARIVSYDAPVGSTPVLVGNPQSRAPVLVDLPRREKGGCWSQPSR